MWESNPTILRLWASNDFWTSIFQEFLSVSLPRKFSIHIKEFVTPTGLEPVIFTVKGWCPNQLDDSAMSNQCCHRCMATSLICESYQNLLPYWCPISLPGSLMDKHQKVTVTPTRFFLLRPTLCFTLNSNTIVQEHSVFTHTLSHTLLINCITTSLGGFSTDQL